MCCHPLLLSGPLVKCISPDLWESASVHIKLLLSICCFNSGSVLPRWVMNGECFQRAQSSPPVDQATLVLAGA